jgi:hypothetical protein
MSETAILEKPSASGGKWLLATLLMVSVALNVKLSSNIGRVREAGEQQRKRAVAATDGLDATAHLLYLTRRSAIADACLINILYKRESQQSNEVKAAIAEEHEAERDAGIECQELEADRSREETNRLVEEKIQQEMRKVQ